MPFVSPCCDPAPHSLMSCRSKVVSCHPAARPFSKGPCICSCNLLAEPSRPPPVFGNVLLHSVTGGWPTGRLLSRPERVACGMERYAVDVNGPCMRACGARYGRVGCCAVLVGYMRLRLRAREQDNISEKANKFRVPPKRAVWGPTRVVSGCRFSTARHPAGAGGKHLHACSGPKLHDLRNSGISFKNIKSGIPHLGLFREIPGRDEPIRVAFGKK